MINYICPFDFDDKVLDVTHSFNVGIFSLPLVIMNKVAIILVVLVAMASAGGQWGYGAKKVGTLLKCKTVKVMM